MPLLMLLFHSIPAMCLTPSYFLCAVGARSFGLTCFWICCNEVGIQDKELFWVLHTSCFQTVTKYFSRCDFDPGALLSLPMLCGKGVLWGQLLTGALWFSMQTLSFASGL